MTRIYLVEDHPIMRDALCMMLEMEADMEVCGEAETAEAALGAIAAAAPDVVLVDVSLPGMSGIELVPLLLQREPAFRCLMLSGHREKQYVEQALAAGAQGYVVKSSLLDELTDGIRRVMQGERYLSRSLNYL